MFSKGRYAALLLAAFVLMGSGCPTSDDEPDVWAITSNHMLLKFDLENPAQVDESRSISGIAVGEQIVGADFRPRDGRLYAFAIFVARGGGTLYTINTATGVATPVGLAKLNVKASEDGIPFFGFDFDPVSDEIRIVTSFDENARMDPDTGAIVFETPLNPSSDIVAAAYTNNDDGTTVTTLLALDHVLDDLVRIGGPNGNPSPNLGVVTSLGDLGIDITADTSFDIHRDGTAVAIVAGARGIQFNDVYKVDVGNVTVDFVGSVPTGGFDIVAMSTR